MGSTYHAYYEVTKSSGTCSSELSVGAVFCIECEAYTQNIIRSLRVGEISEKMTWGPLYMLLTLAPVDGYN